MSELTQLMEKKLKVAQAEHRISTEAVEVLTYLQQFVPDQYKVVFKRSLLNAQCRRRDKAAQKVLFWSNEDSVTKWMKKPDPITQWKLESVLRDYLFFSEMKEDCIITKQNYTGPDTNKFFSDLETLIYEKEIGKDNPVWEKMAKEFRIETHEILEEFYGFDNDQIA